MKTRQVTVREGELLGPIDWDYDFRQHFDTCSHPEESLQRSLALLWAIERAPDKYEATSYGGWPRCGWGSIIAVGMYDGWPYWRPVPSVMIRSWTGSGEWTSFRSITDIRNKGDEWPIKLELLE